MLALHRKHTVADLGRGRAGQDERLDVRADRLAEHIVGDVLVVAARDQDDLLLEGFKTGNRARRAGSNRVVIVLDAVLLAHKLNAVLNTTKRGRDRTDIIIRCVALYHRRRHHHVINVVCTGNANIRCRHQLAPRAALRDIDHIVLEEHTVGELLLFACAEQVARSVQRPCHLVVKIEDKTVIFALIAIDRGFGLHILVKILVVIQMVWRKVGNRRNMGRMPHAHQLE